jgi:hypothetical protein
MVWSWTSLRDARNALLCFVLLRACFSLQVTSDVGETNIPGLAIGVCGKV